MGGYEGGMERIVGLSHLKWKSRGVENEVAYGDA